MAAPSTSTRRAFPGLKVQGSGLRVWALGGLGLKGTNILILSYVYVVCKKIDCGFVLLGSLKQSL